MHSNSTNVSCCLGKAVAASTDVGGVRSLYSKLWVAFELHVSCLQEALDLFSTMTVADQVVEVAAL
jgi:hypothetical protein